MIQSVVRNEGEEGVAQILKRLMQMIPNQASRAVELLLENSSWVV